MQDCQNCQNCFDGQEYLQQRLPIAMGSTLLQVSGYETRIDCPVSKI